MNLRSIVPEDYQKLIDFWRENYFVKGIDSYDRFKLFLKKNPELSVLMETDDQIIGTALGSFDGRRGYIQKLVVKKDFQRKGIGKQLVKEVMKRLKSLGVVYVPINCEVENESFYEKCGFKKTKQVTMSMDL